VQVDRIYLNTPDMLRIQEGSGREVSIKKSAEWTDAVVWNPWIEKSKGMGDLGDEEYTGFVCVEVARTAPNQVVVQPGASWKASVEYEEKAPAAAASSS